ncbi:hypothetical protein [Aquimarina sp. AU474]|uniref:hypothetical protein n=1 Tax=Aquimarina sp. AU474 TaxID=2108529 RepID=UPI000D699F45|nr:hypothetical protein [Aquimarina sp. AU474]
MKKILGLTGIQTISKQEQQGIKGSWGRRVYCGAPNMCCTRLPNGGEWCDFGYCQSNGNCIWA